MSTLSSLAGQHFAYAYGRTSVLQQLLLSKSDIDRMLGSRGREDIEKIFTELELTSMIDQGVQSGEVILQRTMEWIRSEVGTMSPESKRPTFGILWHAADAALLSFMIKKRHNLVTAQGHKSLIELRQNDPSSLLTYFIDSKKSAVPNHVRDCIERMCALENPTPQYIDAQVSKCIASLQKELAKKSGSKLIQRFVSHSIDIQNIKVALRNYDEQTRRDALVEGGTISIDSLVGTKEDVLGAVNASSLSYTLSDAIDSLDNDPIGLERACANVLAQDIADMWNIPLSIEPLFAFAAIASSNVFLMRTILIGKGNELSPQEVKSILPPFISASYYVTS